jgi:cobalt-zinc-cadmium efflux system outer membrane protein
VKRAALEVATADLARERAVRGLAAARARLAARWAGAGARFTEAEGELPPGLDLPPLPSLVPLLARNPDLARWDAEIRVRAAEEEAARAARVPDLTLGAGHRRFEGSGDRAYVFEASFPLPLFDRGSGTVDAAGARAAAARARRNAEEARLRAALETAHGEAAAAAHEVRLLRESLVPSAREVLEATGARYRAGKDSILDVQDVRRTLAEARLRESEALVALQGARISLERLVAGPLDGGGAARGNGR